MNWKFLNKPLGLADFRPDQLNIDPLVGAALITGGAGLVGSILNTGSQNSANRANLQAVRETNKANLDLYREQFADQYKMWLENNQYNSPSAQVSRLRAAGLNPALMMQNGGANQAQAMTVPSANPMQAGHVEPALWNFSDVATSLAAIGNSANQISQARGNNLNNQFLTRMRQAELEQLHAQTKLALQHAKNGSMEYSLLNARYKMESLQLKALNDNYGEYSQSFALNNELVRANTSLVRQQAKNARAQELFTDVQTKLAGLDLKYKDQNLKLAIQQFVQSIALMGSQMKVNKNTAKLLWQQALSEKEVTKGHENQNKLFDETFPYVLDKVELENDLIEENIHSSRYNRSGFKVGPLDVKEYHENSPWSPHYSRRKHGSGFTSSW